MEKINLKNIELLLISCCKNDVEYLVQYQDKQIVNERKIIDQNINLYGSGLTWVFNRLIGRPIDSYTKKFVYDTYNKSKKDLKDFSDFIIEGDSIYRPYTIEIYVKNERSYVYKFYNDLEMKNAMELLEKYNKYEQRGN